jgi:CPA2 family monovalent cation:H+ antiporter-2
MPLSQIAMRSGNGGRCPGTAPVAMCDRGRLPSPAKEALLEHEQHLIVTIVVGLVLAFCMGFGASKVRLPPLVGYLLAGVVIGPYTPGFVADAAIGSELAEIGVILLMFGVGLHFSAGDLMAVRGIAIPGAVVQIAVATVIGIGVSELWGWSFGGGLVLGLSLSVASTVVLLRALDERNAVDSVNGRIAVGWLIVEDLAMVLALVALPAVAGMLGSGEAAPKSAEASFVLGLLITVGKVVVFVAVTLTLGPKVVPWLLGQVARTGSRELFTLSVLAVALGIAWGAAKIFGVSFALGAFCAGVVLSKSDFSHRAATESLPLQDAFAVLFFVSVGMLFDPMVLVRDPLAVIAVLAVILVGKSLAAFGIVLALGYPANTALLVSASLAQIGEFSFILAGLGVVLGLMPESGRDLILAGALLSITLNPLMFALVDPATGWLSRRPRLLAALEWAGTRRYTALELSLRRVDRQTEEATGNLSLQTEIIASRFPIFAELTASQREELIALFKPRSALPGQRVVRIGDEPDRMYFISAGQVEVGIAGRKIGLGPGEFFGEMGVLTGARRTADITAIDYCQFLTLEREDVQRFVERHPELRHRLAEVAERRGEMNRAQAELPLAPAAP